MPSNTRLPSLQPASSFRSAVRDAGQTLKDRYRDDIFGLAQRFGLKFPRKPVLVMIDLGVITEEEAVERFGNITPGLREWIEDVCSHRVTDAAVVGPRGGGKSQGVSFIEFRFFYIDEYDCLNLGGSELQADQVYQYLTQYGESDPYWKTLVKGDVMRERTNGLNGNWIRVLAASSKSVRSPHAGGEKMVRGVIVERGGVLVIDEEAEAAPEIVNAALPTVDTALPSVSVRCSTFHNAVGTFAELVDNHVSMGYTLYSWDIFDVAKRCECVGQCQAEEECFRQDHVEKVIDPDTGEEVERLVHKAYCGGRAMYADGWIPLPEITKLWRRMKRNHATWEVEAMGSRPSSKGHVIKHQLKFNSNIVEATGEELYVSGQPVSITVDWGTVAAGIEAWQVQFRDGRWKHALIYCNQLEEAGLLEIVGEILGLQSRWPYEVSEVAADIGGGGNYLNPYLREHHRMEVRDVNFQTEKEQAVAALNVISESGNLLIPVEFEDFVTQIRRWRRNDAGQIRKGNDHLCDSSVCYFTKFFEELGLTHVQVAPRSFRTSVEERDDPWMHRGVVGDRLAMEGRVPVARGFGGRRRR